MTAPTAAKGITRPDAATLRALAGKYRTLHRLRQAHAADGTVVARADAQALAKEFPGALRELDTLSLAEIGRRAQALEQAADGGTIEPWMAWIGAYHALMRGALRIKAELARGTTAKTGGRHGSRPERAVLSAARVEKLAADASAAAGHAIDEEFVSAVVRPPQGRVGRAVLAEMSRAFAVPVEDLRRFVGQKHRPRGNA